LHFFGFLIEFLNEEEEEDGRKEGLGGGERKEL